MKTLILPFVLLPVLAFAQADARTSFLQQQAFAEMQRVTGEVSALQGDVDGLRTRLNKLETTGNGEAALRAEIQSLRSALDELRREMNNQREEIIRDLSSRIAKMQPKDPPTPPPSTPSAITGPTSTYTVKARDSLYLIAQAFGTTVAKLKEMNGLKGDTLKIGQKLIVPQN